MTQPDLEAGRPASQDPHRPWGRHTADTAKVPVDGSPVGAHAAGDGGPDGRTVDVAGLGEYTTPVGGPDAGAADDGLGADLARADRGPWLTGSTAVLLGAVLVCGGFVAGLLVQQHVATTNATAGLDQARQRFGLGAGDDTGPGGGGADAQDGDGATATTGTVKLVDGDTVYLETSGGDVITVETTDATMVLTPARLDALAAGDQVTVTGATGDDGVVTATTVTGG